MRRFARAGALVAAVSLLATACGSGEGSETENDSAPAPEEVSGSLTWWDTSDPTNEGPAWKTFILKAFGGWWESNCHQMPATAALLKKYPEVSCAMLSILEPGVTIPPHTGKFKGILRYHLGLQVPVGKDCFIKVDNETFHWEAGAGILFDDTYVHEVQNNTTEYRIILFLNIERKMPAYLSKINRLILRSIIWSPVYFKGKKKGEAVLV